jgi:adenylylsulfate kinase
MSLVLWLFGLPSAGKTTLAYALRDLMISKGKTTVVLDGDELRKGPCKDLGFSNEDRAENLRRAASIALGEADKGVLVICAFVTPKDQHRALVREILGDKLRLIHVDCPQEICAKRDVKGLYAKALSGEIHGLTGPQDPFELPINADLSVPTAQLPLEKCVGRVLERFGLGVVVSSAGIG